MLRPPPTSTLFPYTTLFRSLHPDLARPVQRRLARQAFRVHIGAFRDEREKDRKSTRLNSSHVEISYAVFCLKKKKKKQLRVSTPTLISTTYSHPSYQSASTA